MKLLHVSLTAKNAESLSAFYKSVFGFQDRRPPKRLSGDLVSKANGLPGSNILSHWLAFPNDTGPFLEIHEYDTTEDAPHRAPNAQGFGHLAFEVSDFHSTIADIIAHGGSRQGEVVNFGTDTAPLLIIYMRDPEGNILELEQP